MRNGGTLLTCWILIAALAAPMAALADAGGERPARTASGRSEKLDFDGDYVETVNKRPLDSLMDFREANRRRNLHLYRKRTGFEPETAETIQQMRYN